MTDRQAKAPVTGGLGQAGNTIITAQTDCTTELPNVQAFDLAVTVLQGRKAGVVVEFDREDLDNYHDTVIAVLDVPVRDFATTFTRMLHDNESLTDLFNAVMAKPYNGEPSPDRYSKPKKESRLDSLLEKGRTSSWYAANEAPPIDWIIDRAIESGAMAMIYGDSGIGKTFLAMHLAVSVGSGKSWYGRQCKKRKVLYLDAENGEGLIHDRSQMIDPDGDADVTYYSFPELVLDPEGLELLRALIEETGAELVILDPLMNFMVGDENSVESVRPQIRGLRQLAEQTGCATVLVHHENRSGGYRGSSGFKDLMTLQLHIKESEVPSKAFEHTLEAIPNKQRRSTLKKFSLVWFVEGGKSHTGTLEKMEHSPVEAIVGACKALMQQDMGWPGKDQLIKAKSLHGLSQSQAAEALSKAIEDHLLDYSIGKANKHEITVPGYVNV